MIREVNPPHGNNEDVSLLMRIGKQDRLALAALYDRYSDVLYSTALRILDNQSQAAEVLQEVFLQVWAKARAYSPEAARPFSWVLTLTRNLAIDRLRARNRPYSFVEGRAYPAVHDPGPQPANSRLVRSAVETLPLEQRQAIEMGFLGGMTQHEISESLRQPLGTIKARVRRGMLTLRQELKTSI